MPRPSDDSWVEFGELDASSCIAVPGEDDDKYSRGVLGVLTGSDDFPGAAVLGVQAAVRTGVGMVRYLGEDRATDMVLRARPEVVPADGRVQAWLAGSGTDPSTRSADATDRLDEALSQGLPTVLDAGALDRLDRVTGPCVLTPHAGELSRLLKSLHLDVDRAPPPADPGRWCAEAAEATGHTVLLKGHTTHITAPSADRVLVTSATTWTATAGAGDVLAGILGAIVATHSDEVLADPRQLVPLAATAALVHARAAAAASGGGPIAALDIADRVPTVVAGLSGRRA